ncbi:MAG: SpoIID/LytB domain-containing protein [Bryobacterales bacterium]|nr:SpoIID/LytB domain-containing protein [Bryobacterales bacterium]
MTRSLFSTVFLLLAAVQTLFGQAPEYRVRLFWRSVPEAIEIAPVEPFTATRAPRIRFDDGREVWLRKPLRVRPADGALALGSRYPSRATRFEITGGMRLRVPGRAWGTLPGTLKVWMHDGQLEVEATLAREDYVKAVLAGEGGGLREPEALRALAVAIRSYAFANDGRHKTEGFHFCDTTHCQDLRLTPRHAALESAVDDTADELLWRDGVPVPAYHHADSGGHTESAQSVWGADAPAWMLGRADPYSTAPAPLGWSARLDRADLARALRAEGVAIDGEAQVTIRSRTKSGRVKRIAVNGREMPAADFRFAIGRQLGWQQIRSDLYEVRDEQHFVSFEGKGSGHGVGLSQRGAMEMARQGMKYRAILAFYFPGSRVGVGAAGISWRMLRTERLRFLFAEGAEDAAFAGMAARELARLETETRLRLRHEWTLRVYPTLDLYRNASGLSGNVAAATRGREIHLQPLGPLRAQGSLRATIRHELAHALVLEEARGPVPEWLHEALARWMSGRAVAVAKPRCAGIARFEDLEHKMAGSVEARREAAMAADAFLRLAVQRMGREAVLGWARAGFAAHHDDALSGLLREACQQ